MRWIDNILIAIAFLLTGIAFNYLNHKLDYINSQITINRDMTIVLKNQVQTLADAGLIGMKSPAAHELLQKVKVGRRDSTVWAAYKPKLIQNRYHIQDSVVFPTQPAE